MHVPPCRGHVFEFTGPTRNRLAAYVALGGVGAILVVLGTLCSRNAWLAAGAMLVVGFLVLYSGVFGGYHTNRVASHTLPRIEASGNPRNPETLN